VHLVDKRHTLRYIHTMKDKQFDFAADKNHWLKENMYVLEINDYIYLVPFVQKSENCVFLKTIFRSRKATKQYRSKGRYEYEKE
jgi:hypothetical protein